MQEWCPAGKIDASLQSLAKHGEDDGGMVLPRMPGCLCNERQSVVDDLFARGAAHPSLRGRGCYFPTEDGSALRPHCRPTSLANTIPESIFILQTNNRAFRINWPAEPNLNGCGSFGGVAFLWAWSRTMRCQFPPSVKLPSSASDPDEILSNRAFEHPIQCRLTGKR